MFIYVHTFRTVCLSVFVFEHPHEGRVKIRGLLWNQSSVRPQRDNQSTHLPLCVTRAGFFEGDCCQFSLARDKNCIFSTFSFFVHVGIRWRAAEKVPRNRREKRTVMERGTRGLRRKSARGWKATSRCQTSSSTRYEKGKLIIIGLFLWLTFKIIMGSLRLVWSHAFNPLSNLLFLTPLETRKSLLLYAYFKKITIFSLKVFLEGF